MHTRRLFPPPGRYGNKPFPPQRKIIIILCKEGRGALSAAEEKQSGGELADGPPTAISLNRVVGFSARVPGRAEAHIPSIALTAAFTQEHFVRLHR